MREKKQISQETYEIYWNWLVSDIAKIERSERVSRAVLFAVLKNHSSRFSLNSVAKEMEIGSHVTVREYLEILENLFVLRNVFAFDPQRSFGLLRKQRKVYFIDPFLYLVFKRVLSQTAVDFQEQPKIVEGVVAEHLTRFLGQLFYLGGKKEVDFAFADWGIEVKWQKKVGATDFPKILLKNKILLGQTDFAFFKEKGLLILPVSLFLALLNC